MSALVYDMPPAALLDDATGAPRPDWPRSYWPAVTDVPCPVRGCDQAVVWYEAGYVPGYRVCMRAICDGRYDMATIRHRFLASGSADRPTLVRE